MKKFLLVCTLVMVLLCLPAFAEDDAVINDASYVIASDSSFEVSFSVETATENAWAVISAHDADGRLVDVKIVQVTSEPISRKLGNYSGISYAKIVVIEAKDTLKPLSAMEVVNNFTKNGDTDIPVTQLFPKA